MQSSVDVGEKRLREEGTSGDLSYGKKIRTGLSSLPDMFKQALVSQLISELEPLIRNVVREQLEILENDRRPSQQLRSPRMQIRPRVEKPVFQLSFSKPISKQIFTLTHVKDNEGGELQISLQRIPQGSWTGAAITFPSSVRVELVVVEGQFSPDENGEWMQEEFEMNVKTERQDKRPLIVGDTNIVIKDGGPTMISELMFTDNSSWTRSKKFCIGARAIVDNSQERLRIREAITNAFRVKDNRGKGSEKHHPPRLEDEVWRLEGIRKNGKLHEKLSEFSIESVQDFRRLFSANPGQLKQILGMSEKTWKKTVDHANTCLKGSKLYLMEKPDAIFFFSSTCELEAALVDERFCDLQNFPGEIVEPGVDLKLEAYKQWDSLKVVERSGFENVLTQRIGLPTSNVAGSSSRNYQAESSQFTYKQLQPSESENWDMSSGTSEQRPLI